MLRRFVVISLVGMLCLGQAAEACSIVRNERVTFRPASAKPGEVPPPMPTVEVVRVMRGYSEGSVSGDCSYYGAIVFAVPATEESRDLVYQFELISGAAEDLIFWSTEKAANVAAAPSEEHEGKLFFVFPWTDDASQVQEALDLKVRVTAFRRSGLRGGSTEIQVRDPGRS